MHTGPITSARGTRKSSLAALTALTIALAGMANVGQADSLPPAPEPENLSDFVKDRAAAIRLGKALFWDMQVGSDGVQACASCHFNAGADSRSRNQLSPGVLRVHADGSRNPDTSFTKGANYQLQPSDFPFHKIADVTNRNSAVLYDTNDVVSSQGVFNTQFIDVKPGFPIDKVEITPDPDGFRVGNVNVRRVEPRNTPTVINAVYNHRQFWDGRAQNDFNGVNPFGARDPNAYLYKAVDGALQKTKVSLENSSLASQAVGPPGNEFEMSARGRPFAKIGRKLISARPLAYQKVSEDDSVLGDVSRHPHPGLEGTYKQMITDAFQPKWWNSHKRIQVAADGSTTVVDKNTSPDISYSQMEFNFSLFFGLAVQMYEATLISDETPFDRYRDGDTNALTAQQRFGAELFFTNQARCGNCHGGIELTNASTGFFDSLNGNFAFDRNPNTLEIGFFNIGVRPVLEDLGIGGNDPFGVPLSEVRRQNLVASNRMLGVDGAFKVPHLRNITLTAPYFHNGGVSTLEDVIDLYMRGGDFQPITGQNVARDGTVTIRGLSTLIDPNFDNTSTTPIVNPDGTFQRDSNGNVILVPVSRVTEDQKQALLAFLKGGLLDKRVLYRKAPFDHPQLFVPNGQVGDENNVADPFNIGQGFDKFIEIPAVGKNGGDPISAFLAP